MLFSLGLRSTLCQCLSLRLESHQIWILWKIVWLIILLLKQNDSLVVEILRYQNGILAQLFLISFLYISSATISPTFIIIWSSPVRCLIFVKVLLNQVSLHLVFIERGRLIIFWALRRGKVVLDNQMIINGSLLLGTLNLRMSFQSIDQGSLRYTHLRSYYSWLQIIDWVRSHNRTCLVNFYL